MISQPYDKIKRMDVSKIPLPVEVFLGETTLTPKTLAVGDTLLLDTSLKQPLEITIAGQSKLKGFPGTRAQSKAVEIVDA